MKPKSGQFMCYEKRTSSRATNRGLRVVCLRVVCLRVVSPRRVSAWSAGYGNRCTARGTDAALMRVQRDYLFRTNFTTISNPLSPP
jgi:hypothetical protein